MSWPIAIIVIFSSVIGAVLLGIPVAVSLGLVSITFIWAVAGPDVVLSTLATEFTKFWSSYSLLALPLFIIMGEFLFVGGVAEAVFDVAAKWLQRFRGGMALVAIGAGAIFATLSGSALAGIATIGVISGPEMLKRGYDKRLVSGCIAGGGGLAHLIPPSIMAVLYAGLAEISIGRQLLAGFIPGILLALIYALVVIVWVRINPSAAPIEPSVPWKERFKSLKKLALPLSIALLVLGCIYTGVTTATEAAGVGALLAIIVAVVNRGVGIKGVWTSTMAAMRATAFIMLIAVGGRLLGWSLQYYMIPQNLMKAVTALDLNPILFMVVVQVILLTLGMFMDAVTIVVISVPILLPILRAMGLDLMWFGVIMYVNTEIGLITPPVAVGLYMIKGILGDRVTLGEVLSGGMIFLGANLILIALMIAFPIIVQWLPNMMITPY